MVGKDERLMNPEVGLLALPFPAFAVFISGTPFVVIYDSGDGICLMYPKNRRSDAGRAAAEKRWGPLRRQWKDGLPPVATE